LQTGREDGRARFFITRRNPFQKEGPFRSVIDRRSFLKTTAPFVLGLGAIARGQVPIERGRFNENDIPQAREQLLRMVNTERVHAGLNRLALDDLACKVANDHAKDMATGRFLSHWGSDGRKPYQRYSFAGGTDAVQENVSSGDGLQSVTSNAILKDLHDMHQSMIDEVPPNNGHRTTILFPQHTHVGFGIALQGRSVRLDELYIARYVEVDPIARQAKPKASVSLSGKVLNKKYVLTGADVYYEPVPSPPAIEWLRKPRSYGMPDLTERLFPRLPDRNSYPDGGTGTIQVDETTGRFRVGIGLSKKPGINTIMVWLRAGQNGTPFPASQICLRVE
jgi:hypothetical protein